MAESSSSSASTAASGQNAPPKAAPKPQNPVFKMMGKFSTELSSRRMAMANKVQASPASGSGSHRAIG